MQATADILVHVSQQCTVRTYNWTMDITRIDQIIKLSKLRGFSSTSYKIHVNIQINRPKLADAKRYGWEVSIKQVHHE